MQRLVLAVLIVTLGATAAAFDATRSDARDTRAGPEATRYAYAADAFRQQRYAVAYGNFARLADAGDADAASIALAMYRNGEALFDTAWDAMPEQQERWRLLVAATPD